MTQKQTSQEFQKKTELTFDGLGINQKIIEALFKAGFKTPTSIQHKAIPTAITGKDIIGIAQTGTGKTMAFSIPLIQQILADNNKKGLIVLPTRELALQINESIQKIGKRFDIKTAVLIGGTPFYHQIQSIRSNPHIIIGTPGRINDHIEQGNLRLNNVGILVLDEADRMFDMGFAPQINKILQTIPKNRQTMLFSATMPDDIVKIASRHMKLPVRVEIAKAGTVAEKIEHELFVVKKDQKIVLLKKLLQEYKGSVLVFIRMKHSARKICNQLKNVGVSAAEIHSNRSLGQRKEALEGFKSGKYRALVATDIASRGIDVKNIELVVNFDLPENSEDYVHRIGRTGRAGMAGRAISFVLADQGQKIREIERLTGLNLVISKLPELPVELNTGTDNYKDSEKSNYFSHRRRPSGRFNNGKRRYR